MAKLNNISVEEADLKSKINAAGIINSKLEQLWGEAYTLMISGNYLLWNLKLDAIWLILGGDEPEKGTSDKTITDLDKSIYNTGNLYDDKATGFLNITNPNKNLQFLLLKKKSLFLRRLQNKQGKGTAYVNEDEDDLG